MKAVFNRRKLLLAATVSASIPLLAACGGDDPPAGPGNIVEVAQANGFTALLAAATKAGLANTLADGGPFTVFAPTDAAFTAVATTLGFASAGAMVEALSAETLSDILLYHVVSGTVRSTDLVAGPVTTLFDDNTVTVGLTGGVTLTDAALTDATVTTANVEASNGVIHVINKVLVPPGVLNIVQMAQLNPIFSTLVAAVVEADLVNALSGTGPFTVFAPTNAAFTAALTELGLTAEQLLASPKLADVLQYHVVDGQLLAADVAALPKPATVDTLLTGSSFTVDADLDITDALARTANLVATDVIASNGVIHVINAVILPEDITAVP